MAITVDWIVREKRRPAPSGADGDGRFPARRTACASHGTRPRTQGLPSTHYNLRYAATAASRDAFIFIDAVGPPAALDRSGDHRGTRRRGRATRCRCGRGSAEGHERLVELQAQGSPNPDVANRKP